MVERRLPGGFVNHVVRVGDTVRRPAPASAGFVHRLLDLFAARGWPGAPRHLGTDEQGREVLSFVEGHVAWEPVQPPSVGDEHSLARVAELVREFHGLTAGTELAGDREVVCHNDLSPKNTVYRDLGDGLRPVAFIDWDLAAPGDRVHDVAHLCWQYLPLGPQVTDLARTGRLLRLVVDAYRLADPVELLPTVLWWQDRCWRGILAEAAAGDPAKIALRDSGAATAVRAAYDWTLRHRDALARWLPG
ncbi:MAG TPA: phosphotransferase [Micromonospora sp.]